MQTGEKSEAEIFTEEHPPSRETGWVAKPLSLAGTTRIVELFGAIMDDAAQRMELERTMAEMVTKEGGPKKVVSPIITMIRILGGGDKLTELMSIVTGQSKTWVKKNWNLADATAALTEFFERERLGDVLGNVSRSRDLLLQALRTEKPGSLESSIDSSSSTEEQ